MGVRVDGIYLVTTGAPGKSDERIQVRVEIDGVWRCVIDEAMQGPISHIVEPSGIIDGRIVHD